MDELGKTITDEDVFKELKSVSRTHAAIVYDSIRDIFYIEDDSRNGTYTLDGGKVRLKKKEKTTLVHGQQLFLEHITAL